MSNASNITETQLRFFIESETASAKDLNGFALINITFVIEVVRALYDKYRFENFVFYISEKYDLSSESVAKNLNDFFEIFPLVPKIFYYSDVESEPSLYHIDNFLNTHTLCLIVANGPNDRVMSMAAESMKRVRILKTIFILSPRMEMDGINSTVEYYNHIEEMINKTYTWIWHEQFLYTIILTIRNHIYMLDPYPKLSIINKTDNWHVGEFFIDYHNDMKGYVVDTVIRYDLPRVFHQRHEHNQLLLSGISGELFTAFIKSINATLVASSVAQSPYEPAEMDEIVELVLNRSIEMSPHSFTALFAIEQVGISYPIGINDWCIMVPFCNRSHEHLYLIHSFQYTTWLLILLAIIYISVALWLCAPQGYIYISYSNFLLHALSSLIGVMPKSLFGTPNLRMRFIFLFLFIFGFLTSNWYTTKIASYLVTSLRSPQINTIDDIVRSNLRIKVFDYEYARLIRMPEQYPQHFLQQLDIVDKHFMDEHRDTLNTSFGYSIQSDRWEFLNMQQEFLQKPLFRRSDICMGPFYHVFPLYSDSHLQIPFTYFIMYVSQSGFFTYWQKSAFADALRLKLVKILLIDEEPRPLSLRFLLPIWYVWLLGLTIGLLIFVLEVKSEPLVRFKRKLAMTVELCARRKI